MHTLCLAACSHVGDGWAVGLKNQPIHVIGRRPAIGHAAVAQRQQQPPEELSILVWLGGDGPHVGTFKELRAGCT